DILRSATSSLDTCSWRPPRPWHGDAPQCRKIHFGVDRGRIEITMPQQIGDLLQRSTSLHQASRDGVTQDVGTPDAILQTATPGSAPDGIAYEVGVSGPVAWWPMWHEEFAASGRRSTTPQVVGNRAPRLTWQWQQIDPAPLGSDAQHTVTPVHIIERQPRNLNSAQ